MSHLFELIIGKICISFQNAVNMPLNWARQVSHLEVVSHITPANG